MAASSSGRVRRAGVAAIAALAAVLSLPACGGPISPAAPSATAASARPSPGSAIDGSEIDQLPTAPSPPPGPTAPDLTTVAGQTAFLTEVFGDIQAMWQKEFSAAGQPYSAAQLILFQSRISTACGVESANVGPFYCSGDHRVYLDIGFFTSLDAQFGVSGGFAEAYVVAHEMGHHIQNLVGITSRVAAADQADPAQRNALSVRVELQADCLAGVWAYSAYQRSLLEPGDIEEALHAAQVVGDDFLANASGSHVNADSWTHGSSAQRQQWFTTGYTDGRPAACDTFAGG